MRNESMCYLNFFLKNNLFVWLVFFSTACSVFVEEVEIPNDAVIAVVNGNEITVGSHRNEIKFLMRQYRVTKRNSLTPEEKLVLKIKGLNRIIRNNLLIQEANSIKISLSRDEFEIAIFKAKNGYEGDSFEEFLKNEGISSKLWKIRLKKNLLIDKLINTKFNSKGPDDETRAREYYEVHKDSFKVGMMVHAFHIMVSTEDESRIAQKAIKLKKQNFSELARVYSLAPEAYIGGDLGYFEISQMPDEFGSIVKLKNNQVSETIKTPHGYHIFKVIDVKAARQMNFSESKKTIYDKFSRDRQSERFEQWLLDLKNNSNIKINENVLSKFSL
jgi:parvulin-like peptidyl-prolyl isomerase